eukprot:1193523-Prorocentrum_minimum.AAC.2
MPERNAHGKFWCCVSLLDPSGLEEEVKFVAHVPLPDAKDIEQVRGPADSHTRKTKGLLSPKFGSRRSTLLPSLPLCSLNETVLEIKGNTPPACVTSAPGVIALVRVCERGGVVALVRV